MADLILLITKASATLTTLSGLLAAALLFISARKLAKDSFREIIMRSFLFILMILIGVTSMTIYHFTDGTEFAEKAEIAWYALMFLSIIFSCFVSVKIASFGKMFEGIGVKKKTESRP
ncbi:hypothetical protein COV19_01945 [Candidatus Woesearchaeota archaeon CG10_big_fil_rev_8_21_14_0_10_44_13]|nr:MAG: hypothetical protein COV19_01945 [Candidatus Woesearchaeota archaeon CG10_big_fil_rev_8_21_14_0_10_44_13]